MCCAKKPKRGKSYHSRMLPAAPAMMPRRTLTGQRNSWVMTQGESHDVRRAGSEYELMGGDDGGKERGVLDALDLTRLTQEAIALPWAMDVPST
jgi:hypothetical protein